MLSEIIQNFHFIRPYWLWAFIPLTIVVVLFINRKVYSKSWQSVCDTWLLPYILSAEENRSSAWASLWLVLIGILSVIALAGPTWTKLPQPVFRDQSALVIALDLSSSMEAGDIKPSRISRARNKIVDILHKRVEGQTALLVFAKDAYVVSPLTEDAKTIATMVSSLTTDIMPSQGSRPEVAIKKAIDLFKQAGENRGDILLITDGVKEDADYAPLFADNKNFKLSILGVGTADGAPVPLPGGSFLKDSNGAIVVPKLDEQSLRKLAGENGGRFSLLSTDDRDINKVLPKIVPHLNADKKNANEELKITTDIWREEGPWLLLFIIPFVALAFRRGFMFAVLLIIIPLPQPSYAFEWQDLWLNPDQQAAQALESGKNKEAADLFADPNWRAVANYKAENYQQSVELLNNNTTPDGYYNKGNALAKMGKLQEALDAYNETLSLQPNHEDAKYNKKLIEDLVKKQNMDPKDSDKGEKDNQESQDGNSQDQSNNESEDSSDKSQQQNNDQNSANNDPSNSNNQNDSDNKSDNSQEMDQSASNENNKQQSIEEKEQAAQEKEQAQSKEAEQADTDKEAAKNDQQQALMDQEQQENRELQKANETWLRQIPDDPGGLLRRKFRYQSKIGRNSATDGNTPW